ncbi:glutamate synthase, partial [Sulfolobus sp. E5]
DRILSHIVYNAKEYAKKLFEEKIGMPHYEYRELSEEEFKDLLPIIEDYSNEMNDHSFLELLKEKFTIITARKLK